MFRQSSQKTHALTARSGKSDFFRQLPGILTGVVLIYKYLTAIHYKNSAVCPLLSTQ